MYPRASWIFKTYFYLFIFLSVGNLTNFLYPWSDVNAFYKILIAFNFSYILTYLTSFFSALLNVISALPIFLYIYRRRFLNAALWQKLFCARLIFELTGHHYDYHFLKSLFYFDNTLIAFQAVLFFFVSLIPSYFITYRHAFKPEKVYPA